MKKVIFGIFAHPDDEAFGPVATLVDEVIKGSELHLITLTAGQDGTNPDDHINLGEARLKEWRAAGELIGVASLHHFGYTDGKLNNHDLVEIATKINDLVTNTVGDRKDIEIEYMSLDLNGYTGHLDHIVAARSACLSFYQLRTAGRTMSRIRLACLPREKMPNINTSFVFMEPGRTLDEIDETVDGRQYRDKIHQIMQCHHSQRNDYQTVMAHLGDDLGINYFIVKD